MKRLAAELRAKLAELDEIGAFLAAAHLQAAIDALCVTPPKDEVHSKPE